MNSTISGITVSGKGPAVVLLHSSLSSAKQWAPLVMKLRESYTCICLDILGYGSVASEEIDNSYNISTEIARIKAAIEQHAAGNKFHLIGHSFGGAIALKLAVEQPERILSLALFEPVAFHLLNTELKSSENNLLFTQQLNNQDRATATEFFIDFCNGENSYAKLPLKMQKKFQQGMQKVILDNQAILSETYTLDELSKIASPSLLMMGENSPHTIQKLAEKISHHLPNVEKHVLEGMGHMAPVTHAQRVNKLIVSHLIG